jgi:hypothetical protein
LVLSGAQKTARAATVKELSDVADGDCAATTILLIMDVLTSFLHQMVLAPSASYIT